MDSHSSPSLIKLHLKTSNTDHERKVADVYVGKTGDILCPVSALLAYLAVRGALPGPLFQLQDGSPLTKDYFIQKFRAALTNIGFEASQYAGHSFRIGAATTAAEKGIEDLIKAMGRWKSQAYLTYIKTAPDTLAKVSSYYLITHSLSSCNVARSEPI